MKLIIDIPEEEYKRGTLSGHFGCWSMKLHDTILNGTPIPDNTTNGDVIKLLFPNDIWLQLYARRAKNVWWNTPYQKGDKE